MLLGRCGVVRHKYGGALGGKETGGHGGKYREGSNPKDCWGQRGIKLWMGCLRKLKVRMC